MRIESDILKTGGALAVLVGVFVGVVWLPHQGRMNDIDAQVQSRRQQVQSRRAEAKAFETLRDEVEALEAEYAALGRSIPASSDVSPFLSQIGRDLASVGLTDSEIQSETVVTGGDASVIPLSLRIRGSYDQLFDFLRSVETGQRLTRVHDLKITGSPLKKDEPLTVRVELSTFSVTGEQATR